jgi:hypothetical protein
MIIKKDTKKAKKTGKGKTRSKSTSEREPRKNGQKQRGKWEEQKE